MQKYTTAKDIYKHTKNYMQQWFPSLPSYEAFNSRINLLHEVFIPLIEEIQVILPECFSQELPRIIDSMPIVMAQNNRRFSACVAPDLADKNGYCSAKNLYYYGVKLHIIGSYKIGKMPVPEYIGLTKAGVADIKAYEQLVPTLPTMNLFADKAYQKGGKPLFIEENIQMFTPVKKQKNASMFRCCRSTFVYCCF